MENTAVKSFSYTIGTTTYHVNEYIICGVGRRVITKQLPKNQLSESEKAAKRQQDHARWALRRAERIAKADGRNWITKGDLDMAMAQVNADYQRLNG